MFRNDDKRRLAGTGRVRGSGEHFKNIDKKHYPGTRKEPWFGNGWWLIRLIVFMNITDMQITRNITTRQMPIRLVQILLHLKIGHDFWKNSSKT